MTKEIYSLDQANLGLAKTVPVEYVCNPLFETEQVPPENALILRWDAKAGGWYDAGEIMEGKLLEHEDALVDIADWAAELDQRLAELEEVANG